MLKCPQRPEICYYKYINHQRMKKVKKIGHDRRIAKTTKIILHNNKGAALADLNDYDKAITAYEEAIRLDSECALAYENKGVALEKRRLGLDALDALFCHAKARQLGYKG